jgi:glutathione S-transferase
MLGGAMARSEPHLYSQPGSHPCAAVEAALTLKGLPHRRTDLLPLTAVVVGRLLYGGTTVPGMRIGRERIVGSRAIMRRIDELAPEPPLLPPPGEEREAVLEAERWGDEVLQSVPRRVIDVAFLRMPAAMESYGDDRLFVPAAALRPGLGLTAKLMARKNHASDERARADLAALPAQLDKIDGWIAAGLLGGGRPNAADLQIGSTIRLMMSIGDMRGLIAGRAAERLTDYFPPMVGEVPAGELTGAHSQRTGGDAPARCGGSPCGLPLSGAG